ncbi:MAG: hypothetical protein ACK56F_17065, partial [bacterium]
MPANGVQLRHARELEFGPPDRLAQSGFRLGPEAQLAAGGIDIGPLALAHRGGHPPLLENLHEFADPLGKGIRVG